MAEIFLSLDEAAELEGCSYETMKKSVQRNPEGYLTRTEKQPDGGKNRVMVALSSLSKKARRAYKKKQEIGGELVVANRIGPEVPWYVDVTPEWYMENYRERYDQAVMLAKDIKAFLDYNEAERTSFAAEFAAELGISQRTLYRYAEAYLEAESWAIRLLKETGENYYHLKVLALCRKPKNANTFPSLTPEHRAYIENIWFDKNFARNLGTVEMLYEQFAKYFDEKGLGYPSYQTVARYVKYLMETKRMKNAHYLAERGVREYKRNVQMKMLRDTSHVPVLGIVQGDSHTLDFWVQYTDPDNGKISAIRPTMVAWIDTRSRVVMGCVMAKTINSQVVKMSMIKLVYDHGVPKCILIDNGKDYTAHEMTGRKRHDRGDRLLPVSKDEISFYRSVGILDDYRALPYQPWSKGPIERFFSTVCQQFSKWFTSYTGTLTGSKTAAKVQKDVKKLLEQGKLYTMEEVYQLFTMWLEKYHNKPHRGLVRIGEKYTKPIELFEKAEERIEIPPPSKELARLLLMKPGKARIYQTGIQRFGQCYMNHALLAYLGETLPIRYNPEDVSRIYVYDHDMRPICEAECAELLEYQGLITENQLVEHIKKQNRQLSEDKRLLQEARTPFELRGCQGAPRVVGTMNIMLEKNRNEAIEANGTVVKEEGLNQPKSSYFEEQGKAALAKLNKLG